VIDRDPIGWPESRLQNLRIEHLEWVERTYTADGRQNTFPALAELESAKPLIIRTLRSLSPDASVDPDEGLIVDVVLPVLQFADMPEWVMFAAHLSAQTVAGAIPPELDAARDVLLAIAAQFAGLALVLGCLSLELDIWHPRKRILPGSPDGIEFFAAVSARDDDFAVTPIYRVLYSVLQATEMPAEGSRVCLSAARLGWLVAVEMGS